MLLPRFAGKTLREMKSLLVAPRVRRGEAIAPGLYLQRLRAHLRINDGVKKNGTGILEVRRGAG